MSLFASIPLKPLKPRLSSSLTKEPTFSSHSIRWHSVRIQAGNLRVTNPKFWHITLSIKSPRKVLVMSQGVNSQSKCTILFSENWNRAVSLGDGAPSSLLEETNWEVSLKKYHLMRRYQNTGIRMSHLLWNPRNSAVTDILRHAVGSWFLWL